MAAIFLAETAVMSIVPGLPGLPPVVVALLDSALLTVIIFPLLFVLVYRPFQRHLAERVLAAQRLAARDQRFADIADNANEWIWEVDASGRYTYSSPAVEAILGYPPDEVLGKHFFDLFHPDDRDAIKRTAFEIFASRQPFRGMLNRSVHRDGTSVWLSTSGVPILADDGRLLGYRGADTVKLQETAITDPLTGLVNRAGFYLLAEQQAKTAVRNRMHVAMVFADMDNLKEINDRYGHREGDRALADVATVLKNAVRESDIVARFGGDEFVILLTGATPHAVERVVFHTIQHTLDRFNRTAERCYTLALSVGLSRFDPNHPASLDELILLADESMYEEKRRRRPRNPGGEADRAPRDAPFTAPDRGTRVPSGNPADDLPGRILREH